MHSLDHINKDPDNPDSKSNYVFSCHKDGDIQKMMEEGKGIHLLHNKLNGNGNHFDVFDHSDLALKYINHGWQ